MDGCQIHLSSNEFETPRDRQFYEKFYNNTSVDYFVKEYVEDPLRAIVISARLAIDDNNPDIVCTAFPAVAEEYYDAYLKIKEKLDTGEAVSVKKAIENILKTKVNGKPIICKSDEFLKKGRAEIVNAREFYEPKLKELFGGIPYTESTTKPFVYQGKIADQNSPHKWLSFISRMVIHFDAKKRLKAHQSDLVSLHGLVWLQPLPR